MGPTTEARKQDQTHNGNSKRFSCPRDNNDRCSLCLCECVSLFHQAHLCYLIKMVYLHSTFPTNRYDVLFHGKVRKGFLPCQTVHGSIKISISFLWDSIQQYSSSSSKLRSWAIVSESSSAPDSRVSESTLILEHPLVNR